MDQTKKITKNLILSLTAQVISLVTSFVMGFIVPKFIDEIHYAYWQAFLLYFGYVGILHFGLLDGIVLKYSQYDYEQLDKAKLRTQFQVLLWFTSIVCILTCLTSSLFMGGEYLWIVCFVAVGIVVRNIFTYETFTFQITNRINYYAFTVILQKAVYAGVVILLIICGVREFYWYCIADLLGDCVAFLIASLKNRGLHFGKPLPFKEGLKETFNSVSAGIFLMVANLSGMLLVGGAKMVIQWRWSEEFFGKLSFAFSISNLFLTFVTAISVVLFPSLKRMNQEEVPDFYGKMRSMISPLLFGALLLYFPVCWVLERWLPKYTISLGYLGILLPMIVFSSKVSLLTNNYLKVYRKEKIMLAINMTFVVFGFTFFLLFAYVFNNVELLLFSVVAMIMLSSIVSEIVVMKIIKRTRYWDFVIEIAMTVIFVLVAKFTSLWLGFALYLVALLAYLFVYRKSIKMVINGVIGGLFKKKQTRSTSKEE